MILRIQLTNGFTRTELHVWDRDALRTHSLVNDFGGLCLYAGKNPRRCIIVHTLDRILASKVV